MLLLNQSFVCVHLRCRIQTADSHVYLGHVINSRLTDDADTVRQTRSFYARANTTVRKFSSSFLRTKFCCLKPSVHRSMAVLCGAACFNIHLINYV